MNNFPRLAYLTSAYREDKLVTLLQWLSDCEDKYYQIYADGQYGNCPVDQIREVTLDDLL